MNDLQFRKLLPVSVWATDGALDCVSGVLLPGEAALVARAGEKRTTEFTAGRVLAREALAKLGVPPGELLADPHGAPLWPAGVTGSITHGAGRAAAAVALRTEVRAIGIDMESVARFHRELEAQFLSGSEIRQHLAGRSDTERQARAAILFCAKEAWFKCQFPLTRRRIGFLDAQVDVDWDSGRFVVRPDGAPGCASVHEGIARAAIVLSAGAR